MELNCLKATGAFRKDNLLFTDKFPGVSFFFTWLISEEWNAMMTYPKYLSKKVKEDLRRLWYIFYAQDSRILLKKIFLAFYRRYLKKYGNQTPFLHLPISIPTFVTFIFVFENSSNIYSCSLPCGLLRSYFCAECIHRVYPKPMLYCLVLRGPSIACGELTEEVLWSKIWLTWWYMLNGLPLGIIVLRMSKKSNKTFIFSM